MEKQLKVTLVDSMGSIKKVSDVASICYGHEASKNPEKLFNTLLKLGHGSVLEHITMTFHIQNVSRSLLAQLTRHRISTFTVESQRYVKYKNGIDYIIPPAIYNNVTTRQLFIEAMDSAYNTYSTLLEAGIKPEDARYVFPEAKTTNLYWTINLRSLLNFFQLRMDKTAQWEIRNMANIVYQLLSDELQQALLDYVPES